jgi:DnaJ-class molecular chaperone
MKGSMFGDAFGGQNEPKPQPPKDIEVQLECSLYEFYNGCLKRVEIERQLLSHDNRTLRFAREEVNVHVKPGYSEETILRFPTKGNEAHAHHPS